MVTVKELQTIARQQGIRGFSLMRKDELIAFLAKNGVHVPASPKRKTPKKAKTSASKKAKTSASPKRKTPKSPKRKRSASPKRKRSASPKRSPKRSETSLERKYHPAIRELIARFDIDELRSTINDFEHHGSGQGLYRGGADRLAMIVFLLHEGVRFALPLRFDKILADDLEKMPFKELLVINFALFPAKHTTTTQMKKYEYINHLAGELAPSKLSKRYDHHPVIKNLLDVLDMSELHTLGAHTAGAKIPAGVTDKLHILARLIMANARTSIRVSPMDVDLDNSWYSFEELVVIFRGLDSQSPLPISPKALHGIYLPTDTDNLIRHISMILKTSHKEFPECSGLTRDNTSDAIKHVMKVCGGKALMDKRTHRLAKSLGKFIRYDQPTSDTPPQPESYESEFDMFTIPYDISSVFQRLFKNKLEALLRGAIWNEYINKYGAPGVDVSTKSEHDQRKFYRSMTNMFETPALLKAWYMHYAPGSPEKASDENVERLAQNYMFCEDVLFNRLYRKYVDHGWNPKSENLWFHDDRCDSRRAA